jgi:hypothetical protein
MKPPCRWDAAIARLAPWLRIVTQSRRVASIHTLRVQERCSLLQIAMHDIAPCLRGERGLRAASARASAVRRTVMALKGLQRTVYALHEARGRDVRADKALGRFKLCLMAVAAELHAIIEASASMEPTHPPRHPPGSDAEVRQV